MSSDWPELVQQRVRALSKTCPLKKLNSSFLKSSNKDVKGSAHSIFSNRHSKRRMMPAPSMARGEEELPIHHHHHHHGLPPDLPRSNQNAYLHLQRKSRETKGFNYEEEAKRVDTDTDLEKRLIHSSCSCRGEPQTKRTRRRRQQDCVPKKANLIRHHISLPFSVVATSSNAVHDYNEVVNQKDQGGSKVMKQSTNSNGESFVLINFSDTEWSHYLILDFIILYFDIFKIQKEVSIM